MKKIKVVYISGIGGSGSTLLDMLISTNSKTFSVREVYKFYALNKNIRCACGKNVKNCNFWKQVSKNKIKIINHMNPKGYLKIFFNLLNPFVNKIKFRNTSDNKSQIKLIEDYNNKNVEIIIDSSKEIGRLIELHNDFGDDFYTVFIIRDPRATAFSFSTKRQSKGKNYYLALFKWLFMNTMIIVYLKRFKPKALVVDYKALCKSPDKEIPKDYIKKIRNLNDYHNLADNRIAQKKNRKNFQGIKCDNLWRENLSLPQKIVGVPFQVIYKLIKIC